MSALIHNRLASWPLFEATKVARIGIRYVRPRIATASTLGHGSQTLAASLSILTQQVGLRVSMAGIYIPHFWAVFVHDGRGPITPKEAKVLVWFRDREEDPRLQGGITPERAYRIPRLKMTPEEFKRARATGQIIVAKRSGPVAGNPFFSNSPGGGMHGFGRQVRPLIRADFEELIRSALEEAGVRKVVRPVRVRFG